MLAEVSQICASCAEVGTFPGSTEPHEYMCLQEQRNCLQGRFDTVFRCIGCDTVWIRHTDKWGCSGGFKLKPSPG